MFQRILVPLNGSELAEQVLPHVVELARGTGVQIILLRVPVYSNKMVNIAFGPYGYFLSVSPEECENVVKTAMEYLNKVRKQLAAQGIGVYCTVQDGPVVGTILQVARERRADLIAMVTHPRSLLRHVISGSIAEKVLREAHALVLLIRAENECPAERAALAQQNAIRYSR